MVIFQYILTTAYDNHRKMTNTKYNQYTGI